MPVLLILFALAVGLLAACEETVQEEDQSPVPVGSTPTAAGEHPLGPILVGSTTTPTEEQNQDPLNPAARYLEELRRQQPFRVEFTNAPRIGNAQRMVGLEFTQGFNIERVGKFQRESFNTRILFETSENLELLDTGKGKLQRVEGPRSKDQFHLEKDTLNFDLKPKQHHRLDLSAGHRTFQTYEDTLVLRCTQPENLSQGWLQIVVRTDDVTEVSFCRWRSQISTLIVWQTRRR